MTGEELNELNEGVREMTGEELNELNGGLPWWVKKKIIDAQNRRREPHPAPPPLSLLHRRAAVPAQCEYRLRRGEGSTSEASRFLDDKQHFILPRDCIMSLN